MGAIIQKGIKYGSGNDGFSPIVTVTDIENGHKVDVRDINGVKSFEVLNGADGIDAPCDGLMFTSLEELGLTAPVSIGEVFNAMPDKTMLMLNVNNAANADATVTDAPHNQGVLVINKHNSGRFGIEFNYSLGGNGNTIRKWIGTLKGSDGTGLNWKEVAYLNDHAMKSYSSLADLELDTTATINDIVGKMANNSMFVYKTDVFDLTQYENLQFATVTIIKQSGNRVQAIMTDKDTGSLYIGYMDSANKFVGWNKNIKNSKGLVTNAQNFKIDITKTLKNWYGFLKFSFTYGDTPCEIYMSIKTGTNYVPIITYTITGGINCVNSITYNGTDTDAVNIIIGVNLTAKVYGTQVVEMPSEFGVVNSFTAEQFTGDTSATFKGYDAKPITELTDLGLDGSATIQNVMDKMSIGQHCIINTTCFDDKTQVDNIEYGKVEIRRLSSGMWSLWLEDVLHGNVVAHGTCSNGKFAGWHYFTTKSYVDNLIADLQAQIDALK